ncbi:MAG: c-type cytochrome [Kiloniellales bacterium]|nr:c-type cytochrome [Kiloniellales bacterium]MDJ0980205.1 c-type cytochrome [Kiloniellales bacterium]
MKLERGGLGVLIWTTCLVALFLFPPNGQAETVKVGDIEIDPQDFSSQQDPQARVAKCLACHGEHAGGDIDFGPDVHFGTPALRGMEQEYLKQSLIDYKTGSRPHEEMQVIAAMLDEETIDFMARTFAAYPAPPLKTPDALAKLAKEDLRFRRGQSIAQEGVLEKEVPACMGCHGASGEGDADLGPRLAGQNSIYVQQQFKAYADQSRQSAQAEIMQPVAAGLSAEEIDAVAYYYQHLVEAGEP